ncbi:MAG: phenylacetate--CoA ligase family protein, partial [Thermodesulfobacteriota bacterium]|nr:phenylacetate--CoA ligase family protein [Thermodesulfobacteriota bacterium]
MLKEFNTPKLINIDELKKIQWKRLKSQIKYCYDNSPLYYRKKFDEIGVQPEDVKTWKDFQNLPIMGGKEEERASQEESIDKLGHPYGTYLCAPPEKILWISSTGGTTGTPTFTYLATNNDIKIMEQSMGRIFDWVGLKPGDLVANLFAQSMHAFGFQLNHCLVNAGLCTIPLGAEAGSERMLGM